MALVYWIIRHYALLGVPIRKDGCLLLLPELLIDVVVVVVVVVDGSRFLGHRGNRCSKWKQFVEILQRRYFYL